MKTKGLTRQELSAFCAGVSVLLGSGSGMEEAVGLYAEDSTGALEAACKAMVPNMSLGFGEAAAQTELFPDYALAVMQTAEASGRLEEGLGRLAEYYDRQDALEKKVRSAITYPAALLLLLGGVLAVLVFGVMPMFQNVYDNVTGGLAASSYAYVLWAEVLSRVGLCVAILASVGLLVLAAVQRRDPEKLRPRFARFPLTKDAFLTMAKANMTDMLATQLCSGMDGAEALDSVLLHTEHKDLKAALERCREYMGEGESLAKALFHARIFPGLSGRMLLSGEESGTLAETMVTLAEKLSGDAWEALEALVDRVEPVLVGFLTVCVGLTLVSVMLPLLCVCVPAGFLWTRAARQNIRLQSRESVRQAVLRSAVECYCVEGAYPESLGYLEENYGLNVNHRDFIVTYEVFASNVAPDVRVLVRGEAEP